MGFVARLDSHNVRHICRVEELGAKDRKGKLRTGAKDLSYARWGRPLPIGPDDHVIAGVLPRGAASNVAKIEGAAVNKLNRVVPRFFHTRHRQHYRLGSQIHEHHGIGCITVWRDDRRVLVRRNMVQAANPIERRLVLAGAFVDSVVVHYRVVHHDRQAVDIAFFRNCPRLRWSDVRPAGEVACR
ncbi:hypothetical protein D3C85_1021170 [compost metagenome]